jgi:hypothetical protein
VDDGGDDDGDLLLDDAPLVVQGVCLLLLLHGNERLVAPDFLRVVRASMA